MWPTGLLFKKYYSFNRQILLILFHKIDVIVFIFRSNILDLPDDVIIHILSFLSVQDILINVSRVNNFLYSVVKNYPRLWETIHFSDVFTLDENILKIILNNSKHIQTLDLGCQEITLDEDYFNRLLQGLSEAQSLKHLNLSELNVVNLTFLRNLHALTSLDLSGASKVNDAQLVHMSSLVNLEYLSLSFTAVTAKALLRLLTTLKCINILDLCAIKFRFSHFVTLTTECPKLQHLQLSFENSQDEKLAYHLVDVSDHCKRIKMIVHKIY